MKLGPLEDLRQKHCPPFHMFIPAPLLSAGEEMELLHLRAGGEPSHYSAKSSLVTGEETKPTKSLLSFSTLHIGLVARNKSQAFNLSINPPLQGLWALPQCPVESIRPQKVTNKHLLSTSGQVPQQLF